MEERIKARNLEIQLDEEGELRFLKNERTLSELSGSIRKGNLRIKVIPEGAEREKEQKTYSKK